MARDLPIGNGNVLINFDAAYNIRDMYYPLVGQDQHPHHPLHHHPTRTPRNRSPEQLGPLPGAGGPAYDGYSIVRRTRAGVPAAIENAGMSAVTTEFAPITDRSPSS